MVEAGVVMFFVVADNFVGEAVLFLKFLMVASALERATTHNKVRHKLVELV